MATAAGGLTPSQLAEIRARARAEYLREQLELQGADEVDDEDVEDESEAYGGNGADGDGRDMSLYDYVDHGDADEFEEEEEEEQQHDGEQMRMQQEMQMRQGVRAQQRASPGGAGSAARRTPQQISPQQGAFQGHGQGQQRGARARPGQPVAGQRTPARAPGGLAKTSPAAVSLRGSPGSEAAVSPRDSELGAGGGEGTVRAPSTVASRVSMYSTYSRMSRMSASSKGPMHQNSSQVNNILNPVNGMRGEMERLGLKPHNHHADNMRAIKVKQQQNRMKRLEEESRNLRKAHNPFAAKKYGNVSSRVENTMQVIREDGGDDEEEEMYQPQRTRAAPRRAQPPPPGSSAGSTHRRRELTRAPVPTARELAEEEDRRHEAMTQRSQTDYIRSNYKESLRADRRPKEKTVKYDAKAGAAHENYGVVPEYVQQRKAEMAAAKEARQRAEQEARDCPPGMSLMSEEERQETLGMLHQNKEATEAALRALPFTTDTIATRRRKEALYAKIDEIDDAIRTFSRPKVYVEDE